MRVVVDGRVRMDEVEVVCRDCGLLYQDHGLDITLPDDQWKMIHPEVGGVLCGRCIAVRADLLEGAIAIRARIDFGDMNDEGEC